MQRNDNDDGQRKFPVRLCLRIIITRYLRIQEIRRLCPPKSHNCPLNCLNSPQALGHIQYIQYNTNGYPDQVSVPVNGNQFRNTFEASIALRVLISIQYLHGNNGTPNVYP